MAKTAIASDDASEALHWLRVTNRILSGDIAPHAARTMLTADTAKPAEPREQPLPSRFP